MFYVECVGGGAKYLSYVVGYVAHSMFPKSEKLQINPLKKYCKAALFGLRGSRATYIGQREDNLWHAPHCFSIRS